MLEHLKRVTESGILRFIIGCMAIFIGISESDGVIQEIMSGDFKTHHGIILLGIGQAIQAFPDMFAGLEYISDSKK